MRVTADIPTETFVGALVDRYFQPLLIRVEKMSQQITDLQSAVAALTNAVVTTTANETALKQKLDAAVAANMSLSADLAVARANAADPAEAVAVAAATVAIAAQTQALFDAAAITNPSN